MLIEQVQSQNLSDTQTFSRSREIMFREIVSSFPKFVNSSKIRNRMDEGANQGEQIK